MKPSTVEKLTVVELRPEDAAAAVVAAQSVKGATVEMRPGDNGNLEVIVSPAAEDAVRRVLPAEKLLSVRLLERKEGPQRLTEVRPRRPS